jgi:hypothetical protein
MSNPLSIVFEVILSELDLTRFMPTFLSNSLCPLVQWFTPRIGYGVSRTKFRTREFTNRTK